MQDYKNIGTFNKTKYSIVNTVFAIHITSIFFKKSPWIEKRYNLLSDYSFMMKIFQICMKSKECHTINANQIYTWTYGNMEVSLITHHSMFSIYKIQWSSHEKFFERKSFSNRNLIKICTNTLIFHLFYLTYQE